jgi:ribosomal protein S18 acetylase RimI-like enzyme
LNQQMPSIEVVEADLERADHQNAVVELVDAYAADAMGNGKPLPAETRLQLIPGLRQVPTAVIFLAYLEQSAVGIAVCFRGFSTFAARPLINVHDLAVLRAHRGRGIGRRLLEAVERKARDVGCCKLTLEVAENNDLARRIYRAAGFAQAQYASGTGGALFMSKPLESLEGAGFAGQETAESR